MTDKKQQRFNVNNMKCAGCENAVTGALQKLDGTEIVEVSLEQHRAVVISSLAAEDIAAAISQAGFPAEPVE